MFEEEPSEGESLLRWNSTKEEWREIPGYEGKYIVSNYGEVFSLPRTVTVESSRHGVKIKPTERTFPGGMKKQFVNSYEHSNGYLLVSLSIPGRQIVETVHTLVAKAFLGPCPPGKEVCHKDGTRTNPEVWNLKYGTRRENVADMAKHGTKRQGEKINFCKSTEEQAREVKVLMKDHRECEIVRMTGLTRGAVHEIRHGRNWKHVEV